MQLYHFRLYKIRYYIHCMLVMEIWKFIHPSVSDSPRAIPEVNMILVGKYIFIFPVPACYNYYIIRTKIIFSEIKIVIHPVGSLAGFPARAIVLWQENVRGTRNASIAGDCYNVVFKYLRQRSNGLKICLPAVFYIYVFSWFHSV
jgi:hypothetical protein